MSESGLAMATMFVGEVRSSVTNRTPRQHEWIRAGGGVSWVAQLLGGGSRSGRGIRVALRARGAGCRVPARDLFGELVGDLL